MLGLFYRSYNKYSLFDFDSKSQPNLQGFSSANPRIKYIYQKGETEGVSLKKNVISPATALGRALHENT